MGNPILPGSRTHQLVKGKLSLEVGQRFGHWVVQDAMGVERGNRFWGCLCDCGRRQIVRQDTLVNGRSTQCLICGATQHWRGKRLALGIPARNSLYSSYRTQACRRHLEFALTIEQAEILFKGNCHYCGVEPLQRHKHRYKKRRNEIVCCPEEAYLYNGIDRLDNALGYLFENSVSCCGFCNQMKSTLSKEQFLAHIRRIVAHQSQVIITTKGSS